MRGQREREGRRENYENKTDLFLRAFCNVECTSKKVRLEVEEA